MTAVLNVNLFHTLLRIITRAAKAKSYLDGRRSDDVVSVSEYGGVVAINNYHVTFSIFIFKQQYKFG